MQSVQVSCGEGNKMTSFKKLIISKCQSLFELDKAEELDAAKKLAEIKSCKNPVILLIFHFKLFFYSTKYTLYFAVTSGKDKRTSIRI